MADHIRKRIRAEVTSTLDMAPGLAGRVTALRLMPFHQDQLPQVAVYTMDEASGLDGTPHALQRQMDLKVELFVAGNAAIDDALDDMALVVEVALAADRTRAGLAYDTVLTATKLGTWLDGEKRNGSITMTYTVFYRTAVANPDQTNP